MDNNSIRVPDLLSTVRIGSVGIWSTMENKVKTVSWEPEAVRAGSREVPTPSFEWERRAYN